MLNTYRLAEHTIEIDSLHAAVHKLCAAYRVDACDAEYTVQIQRSDLETERQALVQADALEGRAPIAYSEGYLEILAVHRRIAEMLLPRDVLLMHGSAVAVDGEAYMFTAKSGTGKTTHTRLWLRQFGERAVVINGDKPFLHVGQEGVTVYGTPWNGRERMGSNIARPLKAICILTRSETNSIEPVSKKDALPMLCQQIYRPPCPDALRQVLSLIDRLGNSVSLYKLGCNMEPEAAQVAYAGMNR